ncbi:hypothetical protein CPC08DRAFT_647472 [Agrocybe pediades]|nr:hypothetical protein CPC08DRAFT_647472 [Agrocybe pediades]
MPAASLLKPFHPNDPDYFPECTLPNLGIVVTEDGVEEVLVDKIVDERRRGRGMQYLVRWVGYEKEHDQWMSGKELENNKALDVWHQLNGIEPPP